MFGGGIVLVVWVPRGVDLSLVLVVAAALVRTSSSHRIVAGGLEAVTSCFHHLGLLLAAVNNTRDRVYDRGGRRRCGRRVDRVVQKRRGRRLLIEVKRRRLLLRLLLYLDHGVLNTGLDTM